MMLPFVIDIINPVVEIINSNSIIIGLDTTNLIDFLTFPLFFMINPLCSQNISKLYHY